MIEFIVPGEPRGKGRPRARKRGNYVQIYTDDKTASYENLVRMAYYSSNARNFFDNQYLKVSLLIYQGMPKSVSKKKKSEMLDGNILPSKKPDIDNVIKAVLDGLNGVAFKDDTQVVQIGAMKRYSENPRVEVRIIEL